MEQDEEVEELKTPDRREEAVSENDAGEEADVTQGDSEAVEPDETSVE